MASAADSGTACLGLSLDCRRWIELLLSSYLYHLSFGGIGMVFELIVDLWGNSVKQRRVNFRDEQDIRRISIHARVLSIVMSANVPAIDTPAG